MKINLTKKELQLITEWFDCVEDINGKYLEEKDYKLSQKIKNEYEKTKESDDNT